VLCFDGDAAGARAAARAMELALPMLTPERSLKFASLPSGDDPDSLVRQNASHFQAVLDAARSPADALYDMVIADVGDRTPEQRAAAQARLEESAGRIADKALSWEYRQELRKKFREDHRPRPPVGKWDKRRDRFGIASSLRTPRPLLCPDTTATERTRILTAIILRHPFLLHDVGHAYRALAVEPAVARLRDAVEIWAESAETLDSAGLMDHLTKSGLKHDVDHVLADAPKPLPACACAEAMPADAEAGWWHFFGFLNVERLREEVAMAEAEATQHLTPETQRRHQALVEALRRVRSGESDGVGFAEA
jgi:DNA primase